MWEDEQELKEALEELNAPPNPYELMKLRKKLNLGSSTRPTGIGYEVWSELFTTTYGRDWMCEAIKAVIKRGSFPSGAELIVVLPGYKGKGAGGPGNRLNYRFLAMDGCAPH